MKLRNKSSALEGIELPRGKEIIGSKVRLRRKKLTDVRNDYKWQSDAELAKLDAAPQLQSSFAAYLLDYTDGIHRPGANRYPLAVETLEGRHIGNCTCYDIDDETGETQLGIMIGDHDYWDRGYGADTVNTLVNHVFRNTDLNRIHLKTLDWNVRAQKCFNKCGFTPCGEMKRNGMSFVIMELKREQWRAKDNDR
jgi:RimJ/RimL family protein N-acetyltransferase